VPPGHLDRVRELVHLSYPHNLPVLGTLPSDPLLAARRSPSWPKGCTPDSLLRRRTEQLVEHLLVGGMSTGERAEPLPPQAEQGGGGRRDRADMLLAALETSTRCLILSGNLYPSPIVLSRRRNWGYRSCWPTWTPSPPQKR